MPEGESEPWGGALENRVENPHPL